MAKRTSRKRAVTVRLSDEELIANIQDKAPEALDAAISEAKFDAAIEGLLNESPSAERPHFYCRKCGEYHLKTHSHHEKNPAK
jgi:hypothetical protein